MRDSKDTPRQGGIGDEPRITMWKTLKMFFLGGILEQAEVKYSVRKFPPPYFTRIWVQCPRFFFRVRVPAQSRSPCFEIHRSARVCSNISSKPTHFACVSLNFLEFPVSLYPPDRPNIGTGAFGALQEMLRYLLRHNLIARLIFRRKQWAIITL